NHSRLNSALNRLGTLDISDKNKSDIKDFLNYISAHGCSIARQCKYIYPLQNIARWLNKDFLEATKKDIERLINTIEKAKNSDGNPKYTAWTKQDYKVVIKKFYKWLYNRNNEDEDEWEIPKLVKFIKINKPKESKKLPSELLTPKDVQFLADNCKNLREKALILTLYESGARIGELLNLKIKDATFDDYGAKLNLFGKTGYRQIRLVGSAPALTQWLNEDHPKRIDKNAYLFCKIRPLGQEGTIMSYASVKKILKELKERSGFEKPINPHHWRHSRASELAEHLSDSVRCNYFGWVQGSQMARIYTHLADTDRIVLQMNGLVKEEKDRNGQFKYIVCPRCETKNPYGAKICSKCFLVLDMKSIGEFEKKSKNATKLGFDFELMLKDPDFRVKMMNMMAEEWDRLRKDDSNS
ncbi:MAG: tyrosine-type recombinase/integrase, partial [Thermoplasmatales archaeon]